MTMLLASLAALAAGPVLHRFSRPDGPLRTAIDGFTFVAMIGLILGHILPESHALAGWWALGLAALGIFGPTLFESWVKGMAKTAHRVAILLGVLGLVAHAAVDGMALVSGGEGELSNQPLALAVILHRIPAGMTLWWLLAATRGRGMAFGALGLTAGATVVGYALGSDLSSRIDGQVAALFQALVAGALLHVVLHRVRDEGAASASGRHWAGGLGALAGIGFVAFVLVRMSEAGHGHDHSGHSHAEPTQAFSEVFLDLALQAAPALALAFLLAGMIQVFLPKATTAWMRRGRSISQSLRGVAFGLPLPICSCGVIPVYRSIVAQGAPLPAALAFLVATPELGLDAILMSWPLLGPEMSLIRIGGAFLLAMTVGVVVGRMGSRPVTITALPEDVPKQGLWPRLREAFRLGAGDLFDSTAPWILLGLFVAALAAPLLDADAFAEISPFWQVPLFGLLGLPVYVCAAGATPLVAVFLMKGISPGAALAFLLTGPATNLTTYGLLSRLHGQKLALTFAGAVALITMGLGYLVDAFVTPHAGIESPVAHEHHEGSTIQWVALGILGVMTILSITRQGARGFVGRVLSWAGEEEEEHEESHCCH